MFRQENLVPVVIVAGLIVAVAILFGTRYEFANGARLDRRTGEVNMCIPLNGHIVCR
jgi:fructose-specific phosphotransferase system IIC component